MNAFLTEIWRRPWLLVVLAFVILIGAWTTIIMISVRHPASRLSPAQEEALLRKAPATKP